MEPKTRRALTAVPLIDEQRPPADYVKSIKLKEVGKKWASRAFHGFFKFKPHCTASWSATIARSHAVIGEKA